MSEQNGNGDNPNLAEIHLLLDKQTGALNYSARNVDQIVALGMLAMAQAVVQTIQPEKPRPSSIVFPAHIGLRA